MQRYFVSDKAFQGDIIKLSQEDFFHMQKVMRMKDGEKVTCVNENEEVFLCELSDHTQPELHIIEKIEEKHELDVCVRLIYGLPKLDKFEYVVQKCTELGVSEIVPLLSKRSLIKTDANRFEKKAERTRKIIKEASKQSKREKLVKLHMPMTIKEILALKADYLLVADEEESKQHECQKFELCLKSLKPKDVINIVVGPEGGFDREEIMFLKDNGYQSCSLGTRILRSETAPLYMMSVIGFYRELKEAL